MDALARSLNNAIAGVVHTEPGVLAAYASDASNHRVLPSMVAIPRSRDDLGVLVSRAAEAGVPITTRGAGTGTAGSALGRGLVIDTSRWLTDVSSADVGGSPAGSSHISAGGEPVNGATTEVVVEPGVVLGRLQECLAPSGRRFGPDPSSGSRCTLGGMVGTDACGSHSIAWGATADNVADIELISADGQPRWVSTDDDLAARLLAVGAEYRDDIGAELGRFPRQMSGYRMQHLLDGSRIGLARSLVGAEGTAGVISRVRLLTVAPPAATVLVVAGFADEVAAASVVASVVAHDPLTLEGFNTELVATFDAHQRARGRRSQRPDLPAGDAWLLIEVGGVEGSDAASRAQSIIADIEKQCTDIALIVEPGLQAQVWTLRSKGAGLASRTADGREAWPGWEDAAVPPDRLADYLTDFRALMRDFGRSGVTYGHFGEGCVHVRIDHQLDTIAGRRHFRTFQHDAAELVVAHGGSLSGEHGDGRARSELLSKMYTGRMLDGFAAFKAALDPHRLFNPGIIVDPVAVDADLRLALEADGARHSVRSTMRAAGTGHGFDRGTGQRTDQGSGHGSTTGPNPGSNPRSKTRSHDAPSFGPGPPARTTGRATGRATGSRPSDGDGVIRSPDVVLGFDYPEDVPDVDVPDVDVDGIDGPIVASPEGELSAGDDATANTPSRTAKSIGPAEAIGTAIGIRDDATASAHASNGLGERQDRHRDRAMMDERGAAVSVPISVPTRGTTPGWQALSIATRRCVGVGSCRNESGGGMCPSFRATKDERDSTRGRARMLYEMLHGSLADDGWSSAEVGAALDTCLGCRACATECPVQVDIATYRSEFLYQRHRGRRGWWRRPRLHHSLGRLPQWLTVARRWPRLWNRVARLRLLRRAAGLDPAAPVPLVAHRPIRMADDCSIALRASSVPRSDGQGLVLWIDTLTSTFRPAAATAAFEVLNALGWDVEVRGPDLCCGVSYVSTGQLDHAKQVMAATISALDGDRSPIVMLEPSCLVAVQHDAPRLVPGPASERVATRIVTFAEAVVGSAEWTEVLTPSTVGAPRASAVVQFHCHQRALLGTEADELLLAHLGVEFESVTEGCCGLAGDFAYRPGNAELARIAAAQSFGPLVAASSNATVIADGLSCRTQIAHVGGRQPVHLAELIRHRMLVDRP